MVINKFTQLMIISEKASLEKNLEKLSFIDKDNLKEFLMFSIKK